MSKKKAGDSVQNAVATLEERVNELGRAVFGSENYGKVVNTAMTTQANIQKRISDGMAKNLHFYNMPTREDIVSLAAQCGQIEERLVSIESMLHQLSTGKASSARKGPPRTKKPKSTATVSAKD